MPHLELLVASVAALPAAAAGTSGCEAWCPMHRRPTDESYGAYPGAGT
jgi:hypothetical protein